MQRKAKGRHAYVMPLKIQTNEWLWKIYEMANENANLLKFTWRPFIYYCSFVSACEYPHFSDLLTYILEKLHFFNIFVIFVFRGRKTPISMAIIFLLAYTCFLLFSLLLSYFYCFLVYASEKYIPLMHIHSIFVSFAGKKPNKISLTSATYFLFLASLEAMLCDVVCTELTGLSDFKVILLNNKCMLLLGLLLYVLVLHFTRFSISTRPTFHSPLLHCDSELITFKCLNTVFPRCSALLGWHWFNTYVHRIYKLVSL